MMPRLRKQWRRLLVTLVPLVIGLLHVTGALPIPVLDRLDNIIYDARLRAIAPQGRDERIVIVDIDERSLAAVGQWPWSRDKLARLVHEILTVHRAALLGFDVVFAEPDNSSGLKRLQQLARNELRTAPGFGELVRQLEPDLDYDHRFALALENQPVVLGYYFTRDGNGQTSGALPQPVLPAEAFAGRQRPMLDWTGYGANLSAFAAAAPQAGFFNAMTEADGVVRAVPMLARHQGQYYESLSLAMFRRMVGMPEVLPRFSQEAMLTTRQQVLESIVLRQDNTSLAIPVDDRVASLIPFRGTGGPQGGAFQYMSAADLLLGKVPALSLKDKVVLVGTTAPGLLDLRVTPVSAAYPGVETHANMIAGLIDGKLLLKPDYAKGFEILLLLGVGSLMALALPRLSAWHAVLLSVGVLGAIVGLNVWLYVANGLVLPLASVLAMGITAFGLNMSYGYLVESRAKRQLADLFGTYVPPELVDEMVVDPSQYSMRAATRELTVMFCDMRGFTALSETMEPIALQSLLNAVFSRLTDIIRAHRGTIDKYMGDCVMAFWGAPVAASDHAGQAVMAALEMAHAIARLNIEHRAAGMPEIHIGIGLNTGNMCVGDMGSELRRSYTVIGDAVNLGARLEGLSTVYGVTVVASEFTRDAAPDFAWQELDAVRVKGKNRTVRIFEPLATREPAPSAGAGCPSLELTKWENALAAYRGRDWAACRALLFDLQQLNAQKFLYQLYAERLASHNTTALDSQWDGTTNFRTK